MASMTQQERAELDELRRRVEALEARVARLGQPDDDTYPALYAREFQLQDEDADGEPRERGYMRVEEGLACMAVMGVTAGDSGKPNAAILGADDDGPAFALWHADHGIRMMAQLDVGDGSPVVKLLGPDGEIGIEIAVNPDSAAIGVNDSQGRHRVLIGAGGESEDTAALTMFDGEEKGAVVFKVPAVGVNGQPEVALEGWPQWFSEHVEKLWGRVHALEGGADD